jgi:hypothetical protein
MMTTRFSLRTTALAGALALASLTGCDALTGGGAADKGAEAPAAGAGETASAASDLDPVLANPAVGDLWAADLTAFSGAEFKRDGVAVEHAYGLLKVIAVTDDTVTVITETGFWPREQGSINDLRGDQSDITWDESEEIPVRRADFAQLLEDEKIVEVRRPERSAATAEAAAEVPADGKPGAGK